MLSQAAQEMGLSNSTVTKWKNTGATPSGETLARVSAYFGVPVGELLGEAVPSVQEERKLPEGAGATFFFQNTLRHSTTRPTTRTCTRFRS